MHDNRPPTCSANPVKSATIESYPHSVLGMMVALWQEQHDIFPAILRASRSQASDDKFTRVKSIYFVQCECPNRYIKIGVANDVQARLKELQVSSPYKYTLLATFDGSYGQEQRLHREWSHLCERGEWFRPEPELLAFIEGVKGGVA